MKLLKFVINVRVAYTLRALFFLLASSEAAFAVGPRATPAINAPLRPSTSKEEALEKRVRALERKLNQNMAVD